VRKSLLAALIGLAMVSTVLPVASGPIQFGHTWGTFHAEGARAVEVDSGGGIYLAGNVFDDSVNMYKAFVVKTDIAGTLMWDMYLSSPTSNLDLYDSALDPSGNLYIVGPYYGTVQGTYYAKIDPTGS